MSDGDKFYALPYGVDVARGFAVGLIERLGKNSSAFRNAVILVNSRRAQVRFREIWQDYAPIIPPKVLTFEDAPQFFMPDMPAYPRKPSIERVFDLAALIKALSTQLETPIADHAYFEMAYALCDVLDEFSEREISPLALKTLDLGALAEHWQVNLSFIELVMDYAHNIETQGQYDSVKALNLEIDRLAAHWGAAPPNHHIYLVGSTGSRVFSQKLMKAVSRHQHGAVILPGFDFHLEADTWSRLTPDHAQYGFAYLSKVLEFDIQDVKPWGRDELKESAISSRGKLLSLATEPAPVTDRWVALQSDYETLVAPALAATSFVFAENGREEAKTVAQILAYLSSKRIKTALVTPDRHLVRQVTNFLDDAQITYNDSAGRPMQLTPIGSFFTLLLDSATALKKSTISALLAHPFTQSIDGEHRATHLQAYRWFDVNVLRNSRFAHFRETALKALEKHETSEMSLAWLDWLDTSFNIPNQDEKRQLSEWLSWHIARARHFIGVAEGQPISLPSANEGDNKLLELMAGLAENAEMTRPISFSDYTHFWRQWLSRQSAVAASDNEDAVIRILGTIEARIEQFDVTILSSLNEGTWPESNEGEHWLNRAMRRELNLEVPERFIGLSAHDFLIGASAPHVVFTRAKKGQDAETIEARWLRRLRILAKGLGKRGEVELQRAQARGEFWLEEARKMGSPTNKTVARASRPWPVPPISARPRQYSVTAISTYMNDPYAYYARYILGLNTLPALEDEFDAREQGILSHEFFEHLVPQLLGAPADGARLYDDVLETIIERAALSADEAAGYRLERQLCKETYLLEEGQRLLDVTSTYSEIQLAHTSMMPFGEVTLKAKADRVDYTHSATARIYDYKSSATQFGKSLNDMQHPQLPLEALILDKNSGFIDKTGESVEIDAVETVAILDIKTNATIAPKSLDILQYEENYKAFLEDLFDADTGFYAVIPEKNGYLGHDYAHLARFGVWFAHDEPKKEYFHDDVS